MWSLNLLAKLMVLHRQILFSLAIAAIADAIMMRTSAEQVPSLQKVAAPRYLELVTSSNFRLFTQSKLYTYKATEKENMVMYLLSSAE